MDGRKGGGGERKRGGRKKPRISQVQRVRRRFLWVQRISSPLLSSPSFSLSFSPPAARIFVGDLYAIVRPACVDFVLRSDMLALIVKLIVALDPRQKKVERETDGSRDGFSEPARRRAGAINVRAFLKPTNATRETVSRWNLLRQDRLEKRGARIGETSSRDGRREEGEREGDRRRRDRP